MSSKAEKSYLQSSFLSNPPLRADGRGLHDYRAISLETGVAPLANGSARINIGRTPTGGGTEVLAAVKLDVESIQTGDDGVDGGRIVCTVSCSPALDDLQHDMTTVLHQSLSHPSLHPPSLSILPGKKSWLLNLDLLVLADAGNVYDALFIAARAALCDTKVPRTRCIEYKAQRTDKMDLDLDDTAQTSGLDTRHMHSTASDFELSDYWDEGEPLGGSHRWPLCVTLNVLPPIHYLDATLEEDPSTPLRLLLVYSFLDPSARPHLQATRLLGPGHLTLAQIKNLITEGEKYARELYTGLNAKLKDEDIRRSRIARDIFARR